MRGLWARAVTVHWDRLYLQSCFPLGWAGAGKPWESAFSSFWPFSFVLFHVVAAHPPDLTPQPTESRRAEAAEQRLLQAQGAFPGIQWEFRGVPGDGAGHPAGPGVGVSPLCCWKPQECFPACSHLCLASCCITSPSLQDHDSALLQ